VKGFFHDPCQNGRVGFLQGYEIQRWGLGGDPNLLGRLTKMIFWKVSHPIFLYGRNNQQALEKPMVQIYPPTQIQVANEGFSHRDSGA